MSGHSKWHSIKHKKGAADAKRGKIFTKIIKEIIVASREGGGDPDSNARLRTVVLKAKSANMPKDNIDRAIKKGTGELEGVHYTEITYEAYGPGGVAILIEALTDNKNRTAADLRNILTKGGGNLGESGCVSYLFSRYGIVAFDSADVSEDAVLEVAIAAGAQDVVNNGTSIEVITDPEDFEAVLTALQNAGFKEIMADVSMVPDATVSLKNDKTAKALWLIENIDDHDDIQAVSTNLDIPEAFELDDE